MKCFICDDPTNHGGVRHSEATGDGRTREYVSQDRTWPIGPPYDKDGDAVTVNPECQQSKHGNCDGRALNWDTDEIVDCRCLCHTRHATTCALLVRHADCDCKPEGK